MQIVERNLLPNCPVTRDDIAAAEQIFGPDVGSLKGKTVHRASVPVRMDYANVPASIMSRYQNVTVAGDIMFVNKLPFFVTISRHIKFSTVELLQTQQIKTIMKAVTHVQQTYAKRGFRVTTMLMDGQFDKDGLRGAMATLGITLNVVAADKHVPEVERHIRTIKDRARSVYNMMPFDSLPARIIIELVYYCVFWLNCFPAAGGVSDTLSPRAIIVGTTLDYGKHCKIEFGAYVQTHEAHDNSMATQTTGAIALRPTGNDQGGHYFYSLTTGRVLNRNHWTELPMPAKVIAQVHQMARQAPGVPAITFANRAGVDIDNDDDDDNELDNVDHDILEYDGEENDVDVENDADVAIAGVHEHEGGNESNIENANEDDANDDANNNTSEDNGNNDNVNDDSYEAESEDDRSAVETNVNTHMDEIHGARTGAYDLRARKPQLWAST